MATVNTAAGTREGDGPLLRLRRWRWAPVLICAVIWSKPNNFSAAIWKAMQRRVARRRRLWFGWRSVGGGAREDGGGRAGRGWRRGSKV